MLGARWVLSGLAVVGVAAGSTAARAQDVVPGGWSTRVGFQAFGGPAAGMPVNVGFLNGSGFGALPSGPFGGQGQVRPQVVNGLVPLAGALRTHGRRRPRR